MGKSKEHGGKGPRIQKLLNLYLKRRYRKQEHSQSLIRRRPLATPLPWTPLRKKRRKRHPVLSRQSEHCVLFRFISFRRVAAQQCVGAAKYYLFGMHNVKSMSFVSDYSAIQALLH